MAHQSLLRDGEALACQTLPPALAAIGIVGQVIDKALAPISENGLRPPRGRVNAAHVVRLPRHTVHPFHQKPPPAKREKVDKDGMMHVKCRRWALELHGNG